MDGRPESCWLWAGHRAAKGKGRLLLCWAVRQQEAAYKFAVAWTEGRSGKAYQHDPSNVEQSAIAEGLRTLGQKARAVSSSAPSVPPPPAPRQQKQDLKFFQQVNAQGSNAADPGFVLDF
jgi:hypothetical protein